MFRQCLHQLQLWLPGSWSSSEGLLEQGLLSVGLLEQGLLAEGLHVEPCPAGCLSPHSVHHSCGQVNWQMWIHAAVVLFANSRTTCYVSTAVMLLLPNQKSKFRPSLAVTGKLARKRIKLDHFSQVNVQDLDCRSAGFCV